MLKRSLSLLVFACGFAAVFGILLAGSPAGAATYYWTTAASGPVVGGSGTWDASGSSYWADTADVVTSGWSGLERGHRGVFPWVRHCQRYELPDGRQHRL